MDCLQLGIGIFHGEIFICLSIYLSTSPGAKTEVRILSSSLSFIIFLLADFQQECHFFTVLVSTVAYGFDWMHRSSKPQLLNHKGIFRYLHNKRLLQSLFIFLNSWFLTALVSSDFPNSPKSSAMLLKRHYLHFIKHFRYSTQGMFLQITKSNICKKQKTQIFPNSSLISLNTPLNSISSTLSH